MQEVVSEPRPVELVSHKPARFVAALLLGWVAFAGGCNSRDLPDIGTVSGVVTLDGKPLPNAIVQFVPSGGRPSRAITRDDGSYELSYVGGEKGALVGNHSVMISTFMIDEDRQTHKTITRPEILPEKYHSKSELSRTVEPKHNEFNFELTSK